MKAKRILLIAVLLLVGVLVLAGCNGDNGDMNGDDNGDENGVVDGDEGEEEGDDNGVIDDDDDENGQYADGTYTGTADGYGGEIEVEVSIDGGEITGIEVVSHEETEGIGDEAFDDLEDQVIEEQGTEGVDAVSGATETSNAYLEAVEEALEEAREDN